MNRSYRAASALVMCIALASCANSNNVPLTGVHPPAHVPTLNTQQSCCQSLATLPYQTLPRDDSFTLHFDQQSPVFMFDEGLAPFIAYDIPNSGENIRIELQSPIKNTYWQPQALLLDKDFNVVRRFGDRVFRKRTANIIHGPDIYGAITIHRERPEDYNKERYLVIYSPADQFGQTVTIEHPDKRYAKAHALVMPPVEDPAIPASPFGTLVIDYETDDSFRLNSQPETSMVPMAGEAPSVVKRVPKAPAPAADNALNNAPLAQPDPTMDKAIEAHYNRLIKQAVASGHLQHAVELAAEAQRAGSPSASVTLADAIKKQQ